MKRPVKAVVGGLRLVFNVFLFIGWVPFIVLFALVEPEFFEDE